MKTPDQAKAALRNIGKTTTQWATEHGYPAWAVYRVLNGVDKAHHGRAHEIAVKLGLKQQAA